MTRYNKPTEQEKLQKLGATTNFEGALTFKPSDKLELFQRVVSGFMGEPKFYQSGEDSVTALKEVAERVATEDPDYVLRLAQTTRHVFNMRTSALFLGCVVANVSQHPNAYKAIAKVIHRADELTEIIAMNDHFYPRINPSRSGSKVAMPMAIKKAVALAFTKFDEYALAKYNRAGKVTLRDALFITHAKPKDEKQEAMWKRLIADDLMTPKTWETKISVDGSTTENWAEALPTMGMMAFIRNLRKMEEKGVDITEKIKQITEKGLPHVIKKSKIFPFRFYQAFGHVKNKDTRAFLGKCVDNAIVNLPKFDGRTLILVDLSVSMNHAVSQKSDLLLYEIAALCGAIIHKQCGDEGATICAFSNEFKFVNLEHNDSIIENAIAITKAINHSGTDAHKPMQHVYDMNLKYDRIIIFTDMQIWDSTRGWSYGSDTAFYNSVNKYRARVNPKCKYYEVDMTGYGTIALPERAGETVLVGGWSERIFELIATMELEKEALTKLVYEGTEY